MKNQDSILIFGASGQIGKSLIRKFTKNNYKVIAVTRSIHRKGYQIKTQSNYGYLELEEISSFNKEKGKNTFQPKRINWSYLYLGVVALTQRKRKSNRCDWYRKEYK